MHTTRCNPWIMKPQKVIECGETNNAKDKGPIKGCSIYVTNLDNMVGNHPTIV